MKEFAQGKLDSLRDEARTEQRYNEIDWSEADSLKLRNNCSPETQRVVSDIFEML